MSGQLKRRYPFPRKARLLASAEFGRVFAGAERVADRYFTVLGVSNDRGEARLGLAISKRAARRAVDRNRIKRVIRESFRHCRPELPSLDIVVMARPAAATAETEELSRAMDKLWQRLVKRCAASSLS
ncbi:MAG: ribonuclease P protein component [Ectothiorhodospiraceae bacterium]|nr:ribonuclease P protein component [Ectothiorhodospiraceae bacterium]